jgi:uncharacterized membrane protein
MTATWRVPAGLVALSAIPVVSGSLRILELLGGPDTMPDKPGIAESPVPIAVHIATALPFALLGALQFSSGVRRRWPSWHRRSGRLVVGLGMLAALSALWMNQFYVDPDGRNDLLYAFRWLFGSLMLWSLVLGLRAALRRDIRTHRAWMTRAYAIGLGAGTQAFTLGIGQGVLGETPFTTAVFQAAGWLLNLAVAEWAIRRARSQKSPLSAQGDQGSDGEAGRQQPHDRVELGAHAGNTSPSLTSTETDGNGRDAGPSTTSPVAASNWLPWHGQVIRPPDTSETGQPWWVQIDENACTVPSSALVSTSEGSSRTTPPPDGMSSTAASADPDPDESSYP